MVSKGLSRVGAALLGLAFGLAGGAATAQTSDLVSATQFRVCSDPANMPFSNEAGEGFENKIAELFAEKLGLPLVYEWYPQATGFIRKTLGEAKCDVVIGYAQGHELVLNTNHYLTSSYVMVTRTEGPFADVTGFSDPALQDAKIGVVAGSPPATHLARNGLIPNLTAYQLVVDTRVEQPAKQLVDDVRSGETDVGFVWGPIGGYFAQAAEPGLKVTPLFGQGLPPRMFYRITMGVRQGEVVWKRQLNSLIRRNQDAIDAILREYGVPLVNEMGTGLKP